VTVTNATASALRGAAVVTLYATPAGATAGPGRVFGTVKPRVSLAAGASTSVVVHAKLAKAVAGSYTIVAEATAPKVGKTAGTTTTSVGGALTVVAPFVSLSATTESVTPSSIVPGRATAVTVAVQVSNDGNVATTGIGRATLGLAAASDLTAAEQAAVAVVSTARFGASIGAGRTAVVKLHFRVTATAADAADPFVVIGLTLDGDSPYAGGSASLAT
jgi:hypothetical protein